MDISVKKLLSGEVRELKFDFELPMDYNEDGYTVNAPAIICGKVCDMGGYMQLDAVCKIEYKTSCARCLKELSGECVLNISKPLAVSLESEDDDGEYIMIGENSVVNIDEAISEELLLSLPLRSLCKEDCLGLCPKCGCNKNEKECSCVTKELDPRWAALLNFGKDK